MKTLFAATFACMSATSQRQLLARFMRVFEGEGSREVGEEVLGAYNQQQRHYHNLEHLLLVLTRLDELREVARQAAGDTLDESAVELAAFFHDVIYVTDGSESSEAESAQLARTQLEKAGAPPELCNEVARLVLLTATHNPAADDVAGGWLCDADLHVLAWPWPRYADYVARVRREYAHVTPAQWQRGRALVLQNLLASAQLYALAGTTDEAAARRNLRRELAALKAG